MYKYGLLFVLAACYLFLIPAYAHHWQTNELQATCVDKQGTEGSSPLMRVMVKPTATSEVTHSYWGYSLPVYVQTHDVVYNLRQLHHIVFYFIPVTLATFFLAFLTFDLWRKMREKRQVDGNPSIY